MKAGEKLGLKTRTFRLFIVMDFGRWSRKKKRSRGERVWYRD